MITKKKHLNPIIEILSRNELFIAINSYKTCFVSLLQDLKTLNGKKELKKISSY